MTKEEEKRLTTMLDNRPDIPITGRQIASVRQYLQDGYYVDFWWAVRQCAKCQRLAAVVHGLRKEEGMKIVEWQPTDNGGSVYALYEFAPEEVRNDWAFIEHMSEDDIKNLPFNRARHNAAERERDRLNGQYSLLDNDYVEYVESFNRSFLSNRY